MKGLLSLLLAAALGPGLLLGRAGSARLGGAHFVPHQVHRDGLFPQAKHVPQQRIGLQATQAQSYMQDSSLISYVLATFLFPASVWKSWTLA